MAEELVLTASAAPLCASSSRERAACFIPGAALHLNNQRGYVDQRPVTFDHRDAAVGHVIELVYFEDLRRRTS